MHIGCEEKNESENSNSLEVISCCLFLRKTLNFHVLFFKREICLFYIIKSWVNMLRNTIKHLVASI